MREEDGEEEEGVVQPHTIRRQKRRIGSTCTANEQPRDWKRGKRESEEVSV
jgi:hypothetical protein